MHFIFEAFHRRPLESISLAYFRMISAIIFGLLFVVYCGYLINQVTNDKPLLRISRKDLGSSYPVPELEVCAEESTLTIVRCDLMHMNWSYSTIPNCYDYITHGDFAAGDPSRCYLFQPNNTLLYGINDDYEPTSPDIRRLDIYWKIDSIENTTAASISVPSVAVELYNSGFSRWNTPDSEDMIPQQRQFARDMVFGSSRVSTSQNTTTTIFFAPNMYQAIRPGDAPSLLGFTPEFVDIPTLETTQLDWPLQADSINLTRGDYHGLFSVQLSKTTQEVMTEQRQHTLLAAVALAGGAYGVLTAIYILLFGMVRMAPFGAIHQLPLVTIRGVEKIKDHRRNSRGGESRFTRLFHRIFRRSQPNQHLLDDPASPVKSDRSETKEQIIRHQNIPLPPSLAISNEGSSRNQGLWEPHTEYSSSEHLPADRVESLTALCDYLQREQRESAAKTAQLEQRLFEFQEVLRAYYINMDYLDHQRNLRRRGRQHSVYYNPRRSGSVDGGWLFEEDPQPHKTGQ